MPEAEPNAAEPPGRPLGLPAVNAASPSGHETASSLASELAKPEQVDVPKLDSAASDQSGRPLGLSDAGSDDRSFPSTLLQIASESAKPDEAGEVVECIDRSSISGGIAVPPPDSDSSRTKC